MGDKGDSGPIGFSGMKGERGFKGLFALLSPLESCAEDQRLYIQFKYIYIEISWFIFDFEAGAKLISEGTGKEQTVNYLGNRVQVKYLQYN